MEGELLAHPHRRSYEADRHQVNPFARIAAFGLLSGSASPDCTLGARRGAWIDCVWWAMWAINLALLVAFCLRISTDGLFPSAANAVGASLQFPLQELPRNLGNSDLRVSVLLIVFGGAFSLLTLLGIFAALFVGTRSHRRVLSWLAFMVVVAAWLTVFATWQEMSWQGQKWRVVRRVASFDGLATSLRDDWPTADGVHLSLGAFMAYPRSDPSTLLLLESPPLLDGIMPVSAVERSEDGALRFELSGSEQGSWLEWHPSRSVPKSFVGGLEGRYELVRYAPLDRHWFLARYRTTSANGSVEK